MVSKAQAAVSNWRRALFSELFSRSGAVRYGLSAESFAACLGEAVVKYLPASAPEPEIHQFFKALRIEELALARGCAAGNEAAWTEFLNRYRALLYQAALKTPGLIPPSTLPWPNWELRRDTSWPRIFWTKEPWRRLRARWGCMNPPSAARWSAS